MTSVEYLQLLLSGRKMPGHFTMPLIKQFCTINTGDLYGAYSQDYRVLTRCQLEMARRFPVDAFNCLGYPYREAADCGLAVEFPEDAQPIAHGVLVEGPEDIERVRWPAPHEGRLMSDRISAIREFKRERPDVAVIGVCDGAFAAANTFLGIQRAMMSLYDDPDFLRALMEWIEPNEVRFALAQVEAGADIIFIGDALASQISPESYVEHVLPSEIRMVRAVQETGAAVRFHICGDITNIIDRVAETGARLIDLDYQVDLAHACEVVATVSPESFVVGNFDPVTVLLQGTPDHVRDVCRECERRAAGFDNFILSPGCEVPPATQLENYEAMLEFGRAPINY